MGEADSIAVQLSVTYLLYTVQDPFSATRQSSFQNNSLSSLFFGGPSLSITNKDWGRDFTGEADSIVVQLLVTHLLYTDQNPFSTTRQSSFPNSFHTLPFFLVDQVLASQIKNKEILYRWSWLHCRSAVSHPSLIHNSRSVQRNKTVQFSKQLSLSSPRFLVDQVLASQIKAEEETFWVKLTPLQVSC